jgi:hypothetical protein
MNAPVEFFAVVRPATEFNANPEPMFAVNQEHAAALAVTQQYQNPNLGPFRVVRLVEAQA